MSEAAPAAAAGGTMCTAIYLVIYAMLREKLHDAYQAAQDHASAVLHTYSIFRDSKAVHNTESTQQAGMGGLPAACHPVLSWHQSIAALHLQCWTRHLQPGTRESCNHQLVGCSAVIPWAPMLQPNRHMSLGCSAYVDSQAAAMQQ